MINSENYNALKTYFNLMTVNGSAHIYRAAREFEVFEAFADSKRSAQEVADCCGLRERPTRLLLDGLVSMGTLTCEGGLYSLSPVSQFLSGNYRDLGDEYWQHLPQFLTTGVPMARMDSADQSESLYEAKVTGLAWMMAPAADAMVQMLGIGRARSGLRILDVGAGSGIWSLTCAKNDPASSVTVNDWPAIVRIAERFADQMGVRDRFTTLAGNYHEVPFEESAFDLAIVANVAHIETPDGNRELFKRIYEAVKPGGEIAVIDVMPEQAEGQTSCALYSLGLGLRTTSGEVHPPHALEGFLVDAGFAAATMRPIAVAPCTMGVIVATRGKGAC